MNTDTSGSGWNMRVLVLVLGGIALVMVSLLFLRRPAPDGVRCDGCNVVIIGVDTLRADRVHSFGYSRETTPNIDALASKSVSFTQAISASSWTVPSFMSIMTGVYPSVHKVVNKFVVFDKTQQKISNLHELSPDIVTLAEALQRQGYATGGFTGDAGVSGSFGYKQGFDAYTDEKTFGGLENSKTHALSWLDSLPKGKKFFMFFHGYDLHGQSDLAQERREFVPKDYHGRFTGSPKEEAALREGQLSGPIYLTKQDVAFWNGLYDSKILSADAEVGAFLNDLKSRGLLDKTVVILLSDHGEEFYEHGGFDHGHALYDELTHVPLIISVPGRAAPVTVTSQVSTMDVAPTIFDILGIGTSGQLAKQWQGQSLLSYLKGGDPGGHDAYLETDYRDFTHLRGVRTADGWLYIRNLIDGKEELYSLKDDAAASKNLALSNASKRAELRAKVEAHITNDLKGDPTKQFKRGCLPVYKGECE